MASKFSLRPAEQSDSADLIELINDTPQRGAVTINFERSPDFFMGTQVATQRPDVWVAVENSTDKLAAIFSIGSRDVYVNGQRQSVRYGNDLRIHPDFRSGRTLFNLLKCYREVMGADWMQTVILSDNRDSLNSMGSGRSITPTYFPFGQMSTSMIYLNRRQKNRRNKALTLRQARPDDIPAMQLFFNQHAAQKQFYPHYEFAELGKNNQYYRGLKISDYFLLFNEGQLVAMAGIWDQSDFKQTRFLAYEPWMKVLRVLNNLYSQLFGGLKLPPAGGKLSYVSLHSLIVKNDDPMYFSELLKFIYNYCLEQGYQALVCGLPVGDPKLKTLLGYRAKKLLSEHFIASYADDPRTTFDTDYPLYLEPARL